MKKFISYLLILVLFGSALNFSFDITQVNANNISKENREAWKFIDYIEFVNEKIFDVSLSTQEEIAALGLEKGKVKIWNFVNREIITTIKETNEDIISLDFSSKKNKLLFVAEDNILRIWDLSDDSLDKEIAFESTINEAMYIPGTDKAVLQYSDYLVLVVDLESEEIIKSFNLPENEAINAFSVCETGRYIAVAGDEIINIWDLNNGELFNSIKWEIGDGPAPMTLWINAVDLSRKAKLVAAGGPPGRVKIWNMDTGEIVSEISFSNYFDGVYSLEFSPEARNLAFAAGKWDHVRSPAYEEVNGLVEIFNIESNSVIKQIELDKPVLSLAYSKVNNSLIFCTDNVYPYDVGTAEVWSRMKF